MLIIILECYIMFLIKTGVNPIDKEILTMEEAAELFGVSVKTFIKLLKEEKVPARKIGREWRFSRNALIGWLSSGDSQAYSSSEGEAKEFFNEVAPEWEEIRKNYYDESIKNELIQMKILKKNMTVMDLGAGDGYLSRAVAKLVKKVLAVDISKEMLKELGKKARENGIGNIEIVESDAQDIPIEDASTDIVCASMYLHHIEKPENAIREMNRLVKPGGTVFIADFKEHPDTGFKEQMHDIWPGFDTEEIQKWFETNHFQDIKFRYIDNQEKGKQKKEIFILTAVKSLNS